MPDTFIAEQAFEELKAKILEVNPAADMTQIRRAFDYALTAHEGQKRMDGSPYVTHVIAATKIAADMTLSDCISEINSSQSFTCFYNFFQHLRCLLIRRTDRL